MNVKPGYARNYLLPQGKALRATEANRAHFENERAQLEARDLERKTEAEAVSEKLAGESFVVIRFKDPNKFDTNFEYLLSMIHDSFMSRRNTIVVPGGKMGLAMEIILTPIIHRMLEKRGG